MMNKEKELKDLGEIQRSFMIERAEESDDLIKMSVSSEAAIQDWPGRFMILDHSPESVRMERIKNAGVGRDRHFGRQICSVERAELEDDKLQVWVRFCNDQAAQDFKRDVMDGIRRNVSIDAEVFAASLVEERDDADVFRATDWEPLGFAFEPYPADTNVGVGRSLESQKTNEAPNVIVQRKEDKTMPEENNVSLEQIRDEIRAEERSAIQRELRDAKQATQSNETHAKMFTLARKYGCEDLAVEAVNSGMSLDNFQGKLLEQVDLQRSAEPVGTQNPDSANAGITQDEARQFSVVRACRGALSGNLDGFEAEMSQEISRKLKRDPQQGGFFVPAEVSAVAMPVRRATMAAGNFATGGATVPTEMMSMIELLRNMTVVEAAGARVMNDLQGDLTFPRQKSASTITNKEETGTSEETNQETDDLKATPHRLTAYVPFTRQLLAQSSTDVEAWLREDLMTEAALKMDKEALFGTGASGQVKGLFNLTGTKSLTYGAAATWAKVVEHETLIETANALMGSLAYVTNPSAKGKWKTKSKDAGSGQFIWQNNLVNEYRALATNQIETTGTYANRSIFGNWRDMLILMWSGMEIIVDPYTSRKQGKIEIQVEKMWDMIVRHPESFSLSSDSAAQ